MNRMTMARYLILAVIVMIDFVIVRNWMIDSTALPFVHSFPLASTLFKQTLKISPLEPSTQKI